MEINDIEEMKDFNEFLEKYTASLNVPDCAFDPVIQDALNLTHEDFLSLSSIDCQFYAFKLTSYTLFLHKEMDANNARILWCEEILNRMIAKQYHSMPEMMKYEIRRQSIILQDTFATKVEKLRIRLNSTILLIKDKINRINVMSNILQDIGKRKGFER